MAKKYRYKPADNRTPVNDPVIGHLEYGQIYDNPACAGRPDFEEVKTPAKPSPAASRSSASKSSSRS